jgi:hypothetical protein
VGHDLCPFCARPCPNAREPRSRSSTTINLRKVGNEKPEEFELTFKDLEIKSEDYYETIVYGTESYVWTVLRNGGIAALAIENLFRNAR